MFIRKAGAHPSQPFRCFDWLLAFSPKIKLSWKSFPGTNTLAFYKTFLNYWRKKFYNIGARAWKAEIHNCKVFEGVQSVHLSICLYVCLSICPSVHLLPWGLIQNCSVCTAPLMIIRSTIVKNYNRDKFQREYLPSAKCSIKFSIAVGIVSN